MSIGQDLVRSPYTAFLEALMETDQTRQVLLEEAQYLLLDCGRATLARELFAGFFLFIAPWSGR